MLGIAKRPKTKNNNQNYVCQMQSMILCGLVKNGTFGFYKTGRIRVRDVSGCFFVLCFKYRFCCVIMLVVISVVLMYKCDKFPCLSRKNERSDVEENPLLADVSEGMSTIHNHSGAVYRVGQKVIC